MNLHLNTPWQRGHTIVELMVVLMVMITLTLVAYPSYQKMIMQARRAQGRASLHATLLQQERYYTSHNIYFAFNASTADSPFKWWSGDASDDSYYEIQAEHCTDRSLHECVLLSAIPGTENVRIHSDPVCGNLMLDSTGRKTYSEGTEPNSSCW